MKSQLEQVVDNDRECEEQIGKVKKEQAQNQKLITAYSSRMEMEKHLYSMAQLSESKFLRQAKHYQGQKQETQKQLEALQADAAKLDSKLCSIQKMMKLKNAVLVRLDQDLNERETFLQELENYLKLDRAEFKVRINRMQHILYSMRA